MRILTTTHSYLPSDDGVAQVVGHVAERLARLGHEVHVATTAVQGQPAHETRNGVEIHRFSASGNAISGLRGEIEAYRAFVRRDYWNVIVDHCLQHWAFDALLDELHSTGGRHVLVSHGMPAGSDGPYQARLAAVIPCLGAWACVSPVTAEREFSRRFQLEQPVLLQNGVAIDDWSAPKSDVRREWRINERPWILNVSNHAPQKGHRTYHSIARRLGVRDARFTLIGRGYPMAQWNLGRFGVHGGCSYSCRARSLFSGVDLRLNATRDQTVSSIVQADVLVSTSRREANSIVLLEAMAAGTPWISFNVGSACANDGGVVVKDETELVLRLRELLGNAQSRSVLGAAGRRRALERHSWDHIAVEYEALLRGVAAASVSRSA